MNTLMKFKKTMRLAVALTVLLAAGCEVGVNASGKQKPDADINPELYRCDEAQLKLVKTEFEICSQSGYFDSYCFAQAKKSQCSLIEPEPNNVGS